MITIGEAARNVGREVVYTPYAGAPEEGVITGVSEHSQFVYVRYSDDEWAKATYPSQLEFAEPETDGGAAAPPAERSGAPTPAAAESATSTAALPSPRPQQGGSEVSSDAAHVGLVTSYQDGQQVLGTCSPGATGSPEVTP